MEAFEFTANLGSENQISIPSDFKKFFSKNEKVRGLILFLRCCYKFAV